MPSVRFQSIPTKAMLNRVKAPSMPFTWSINPYRGCQHGCSFCYARSTHVFLGVEADDTFQNHIFIKTNGPQKLREQLEKLFRSKKGKTDFGWVAVGTATDPYQPIEAKAKITRQCLEILAEFQIPASITTRSPLILRDLDLLKQIPLTSINISIHTLDESIWKNFEPATPAPSRRMETVRKLAAEGLPVGIFMAPILPYLTDGTQAMEKLVRQAAQCGAKFVAPSFLRLGTPEVKSWFFQTLARRYPDLFLKYKDLYARSSTVPASYRERIMETIAQLLDRYGLNDGELPEEETPAGDGLPGPQKEVPSEPVQLCFSFSI